ncbi:aminoacyl-histidine dipeptidase [Capnocytophaga canis]|uniref:Cytosol non-specific dipeptidase n=1 Tax=Capnocytophaga canis TaxID=1848903 RepID=A0A0B7ILX6_9FLAO|nr:aminoacyl-histidine dipeptidase [Capnocytophaga canis]RIY38092.1 aminoacyl-histidine dipeptidase [Capnocytophaga canis]GIM61627.1 aminoacyl-histidine dipeptidase [Capnocytophaga canis]CEN52855.1 Cytosol non-specific dipeptidase [Capnocytophaga canis]
MSTEIRNLDPKALWENFADLNAVPRPSKKEEKVIAFMMDFGKKLNLETLKDEVGNVIIKKPATKGMENRKTVVLQSHLDMVHQKNNDTIFDFDTEGIKMRIDGDWVKAEGTTLGADNGIGVAAIMAILQSTDIAHPAIEALFTIDEETGMTGAIGLKGGLLKGDILLNLDTEEDDEIDIGCAGGVDVTAYREYDEEQTPDNVTSYKITVKGLQGGHSGMDIHKGFGNANKIMNRLLFDGFENFGLRIAELNGGGLRNAIPRESVATIVVDKVQNEAFQFEFQQLVKTIQHELAVTEPQLVITLENIATPERVMELGVQEGILRSIYTAHNGVYAMSRTIEDLVETSNNIARVIIKDGEIKVLCLTRSSVESAKFDLANALRSAFELSGCEVTFTGSYPGWEPNVNASILKVLKEQYEILFGEKPNVVACHAGLECGILGQNYPEMEMISFGPTIRGAHSPDEKVSISSVQKFWKYLLEILKNTPQK